MASSPFSLSAAFLEKARGPGVVGTFLIELPSSASIRAFSAAGFDFVIIDTEHSVFAFDTVEPLVQCAQALGLVAFVRVWGKDEGLIGKALETGANGLLIPHVDDVQRARQVVMEARFPPTGRRSYSPLLRYDEVGQSKRLIEEATIVLVQIEGRQGLDAATEIAGLKGIDGIFVGTHDLSLSLGVGPEDEKVFSAATKLAADLPDDCIRGVYLDRHEKSAEWAASGFRLQCISFDSRMLANAARSVVLGSAFAGGIE